MARTFNAVMIHGLLGTSRDFGLVESSLKRQKLNLNIWYPELFRPGPVSAAHEYDVWTMNFLNEVERRFGEEPIPLVGYSLGGRLALHAYLSRPTRFSQLWLLSTNPGVSVTPPAERRRWEQKWSKRFRSGNWNEVIAEWNDQEVFNQTTPRLVPQEGLFDRELLADAFSNWSLNAHRFSLMDLHRLPAETKWWFGGRDRKFLDVKAELQRQNIPGQYEVLPSAGHRLPLDGPGELARALTETQGEVHPCPALLLN